MFNNLCDLFPAFEDFEALDWLPENKIGPGVKSLRIVPSRNNDPEYRREKAGSRPVLRRLRQQEKIEARRLQAGVQ